MRFIYIYIFLFFSPYIRVCHGKVAIHTCGLIVCRMLCPTTNHLTEIEFWDCYFSAISPKYESMSWSVTLTRWVMHSSVHQCGMQARNSTVSESPFSPSQTSKESVDTSELEWTSMLSSSVTSVGTGGGIWVVI